MMQKIVLHHRFCNHRLLLFLPTLNCNIVNDTPTKVDNDRTKHSYIAEFNGMIAQFFSPPNPHMFRLTIRHH